MDNIEKFTLLSVYDTRKLLKSKTSLVEEIARNNEIIGGAKDQRLLKIVADLDKFALKAFQVNCGGMMFWISPFLLAAYFDKKILVPWLIKIKVMTRALMFVGEVKVIGDAKD